MSIQNGDWNKGTVHKTFSYIEYLIYSLEKIMKQNTKFDVLGFFFRNTTNNKAITAGLSSVTEVKGLKVMAE